MKVIMLIVYMLGEPEFTMTMNSMEECINIKDRLMVELRQEGLSMTCKEVTL